MSRAMLLVICDFLLLSLLALAKFELPGDEEQAQEAEVAKETVEDRQEAQADMLALLQESLAAEQADREALLEQLAETQTALQEKSQVIRKTEEALAAEAEQARRLSEQKRNLEDLKRQLESERDRLAAEKSRAESEAMELNAAIEKTREELLKAERERSQLTSSMTNVKSENAAMQERVRALQEALNEKLERLNSAEERAEKLAEARRKAEAEKATLETELKIKQTEVKVLEEDVAAAKLRLERERAERKAITATASQLAEGVSSLATSNREISTQIESLREISPNEVFTRYRAARFSVTFTGPSGDLISRVRSVFVSAKDQVYGLLPSAATPLNLRGNYSLPSALSANLEANGQSFPISDMGVLASDPRVIVFRVSNDLPERLELPVFPLTPEPFRWDSAILINASETYYGDVPFRVHPDSAQHLVVERASFINRLLSGERFSPNETDFVFTKSGAFMGVLVTNDDVAMIDDFSLGGRISVGSGYVRDHARNSLREFSEEISRLPSGLRN